MTIALPFTSVEMVGGEFVVRMGKYEKTIGSLDIAQRYAEFLPGEVVELLFRFAIARYLALDPACDSPTVMEGRTITFSTERDKMVEVV